MADLSGKVAVVTGAGRGLGCGVAEGLAEAGAVVYVTGRTGSATEPPAAGSVQAAARRVDALGGRGRAVQLDHRQPAALHALVAQVLDEQGRLDVWVNHLVQGRALASALVVGPLAAAGGGLLVDIVVPAAAAAGSGAAATVSADAAALAARGVTALTLWPAEAAAPRFTGRCVAALAMDPDVIDKAGGVYRVMELVREYRFSAAEHAAPDAQPLG